MRSSDLSDKQVLFLLQYAECGTTEGRQAICRSAALSQNKAEHYAASTMEEKSRQFDRYLDRSRRGVLKADGHTDFPKLW